MAKKRKGKMPKGFVSKAQWRLFFASPKLKKYAKKEAHKAQAAGGGKKVAYRRLPKHVRHRGARRIVP